LAYCAVWIRVQQAKNWDTKIVDGLDQAQTTGGWFAVCLVAWLMITSGGF